MAEKSADRLVEITLTTVAAYGSFLLADHADILVFTGSIGEHAAVVRERICAGLECLGIQIDPARKRKNAPTISSDSSRVKVRVIKAEGLMIARHAAQLITNRISREAAAHFRTRGRYW